LAGRFNHVIRDAGITRINVAGIRHQLDLHDIHFHRRKRIRPNTHFGGNKWRDGRQTIHPIHTYKHRDMNTIVEIEVTGKEETGFSFNIPHLPIKVGQRVTVDVNNHEPQTWLVDDENLTVKVEKIE